MQNKGAIKFFAIVLTIVCLFQLSFTFFSYRTESKAKSYSVNETVTQEAKKLANGDAIREGFLYDSISKSRYKYFLDSMSNQTVYNILLKKYTYKDVKERELNLGLDFKGGMNVIMEVNVGEIIRALSGNSQNPTFVKALDSAYKKQEESTKDFVTLFGEAFTETDPNAKLASIFNTVEFRDRINYNSTNEQVLEVIRAETDGAIDRVFNILNTRINRFGVAQPNIQRLQTAGRILIELPGIKDPERVRKLLQGTAQLRFWETYQYTELYSAFIEANKKLVSILTEGVSDTTEITDTTAVAKEAKTTAEQNETAETVTDTGKKDTSSSALLDKLEKDTAKKATKEQSFEDYAKQNPLFAYLNPAIYQNEKGQYLPGQTAMVGRAFIKDTARVNMLLSKVKNVFPSNLRLRWSIKPREANTEILELIALKVTSRDGSPSLGGEVIVDARQDYDQNGRIEVSMSMNSEGARIWRRLTGDNIGKQVAIELDEYVYSYPVVNSEIPNGMSSISGGNMTIEEAQDLANILKAGKLPAPARIVQEEVVGPSLGQEAINAGMWSFILAFILVLLYMGLYYSVAGWVADIALLFNIFLLFGVLTSLGAVLTLPGIAGIVLTMGMAVDANVIIYERIREEVRAGKGLRLAISDGYKMAYSAIIDGNVTTILTGIILYIFGSGPIQGFATTLIIGILTSLFSAIFLTRMVFESLLNANKIIKFGTKRTINTLVNVKFDFIGWRKYGYIGSSIVIIAGMVSLGLQGLNYGIDFKGGRTYIIRFDQDVKVNEIRTALAPEFEKAPEVKIFGPTKQVKITTDYLITDKSPTVDSLINLKLFKALKVFFKQELTADQFSAKDQTIGILNSQTVGPTIAYDIKRNAVLAIVFALLGIFIYIAIRFKNWQFGLGGVISLFHDSLVTIGLFSLLYPIMPFNMEVDQAFIAAILTIIGYSINDSVIIFDRIREFRKIHPKMSLRDNMNNAMSSTLGRTMNTAGTTLIVLIAIFFFGGEVIRGFTFALLVGIAVGTYSSVLNASPLAYDFIMMGQRRRERKALKAK